MANIVLPKEFSNVLQDIPQPNPYLSKIKMGRMYYLVTVLARTCITEKIVVMNFLDSTKPYAQIKMLNLNGKKETIRTLQISVSQVPIKGQRKNIILLTPYLVLCKDKQDVAEFMKWNQLHKFYGTYALDLMFTPTHLIQEKSEYITALNKLKSL